MKMFRKAFLYFVGAISVAVEESTKVIQKRPKNLGIVRMPRKTSP